MGTEILKIKSSNVYNNAQGKLSINLSDGKTLCANLLHCDKVNFITNRVTTEELVKKYFSFDGEKYKHANPKIQV